MVVPFKKEDNINPEQLALQAQHGDEQCRDYLLHAYRPFVLQVASRFCRRYLQEGVDEEFSVALLAFNEAIDRYRAGQGSGILSFARLVIERRLTDYFRKSTAWNREIPFSGFTSDDALTNTLPAAEKDAATKEFADKEAQSDRQAEILHFCQLLSNYDITLAELVRISPKHRDARVRAMAAAKEIAQNQEWLDYFLKSKNLPLKLMEGKITVSRKTLERQRKYIVALLLVYLEDLPYMREYLKGGEEG